MPRRLTKDPDAKKFGAIVRRLREERGWTQDQLAERAGMNGSYLGFVERGENVPTLTVILLLAQTLSVDPGELVREVARKK
ncbi:MAG: helix-turn-helix transcriptional regulator [Acidobacteria bacterium]|nr:helix-turn-helix transcriptional regulator [Acidobacteriota bacterium]